MPDDVQSAIEQAAQEPKRARGDEAEFEAHPLGDQIKADRYLASKAAVADKKRGLRINVLKAPGSA